MRTRFWTRFLPYFLGCGEQKNVKRKQLSAKDFLEHCAEIGPEDGIDPRYVRASASKPAQKGRKIHQLGAQIAETLNLTLAGCADEVLQNLSVARVEPLRGGRMRVVVIIDPKTGYDSATILAHWAKARGYLRCEVAAGIHRRKVPDLVLALEHANG